eukprot:CAMPEP_0113886180 /NCGR_PEP_ID=MMETSP0780_2-20120614/11389_1 /TAXON_ID=652834 /ORGANISM="Palpitomonas bilix" /LENGTH=72 /DNA_ID=CAMNT_0000874321 /DNA_START=1 /DNA_END=219 /DNA_ORIENTATION=- /assembly_acc=CAM_ASM_000599
MLGGLSLPLLACCEYMRRRDVQLKDNGGRRLEIEDRGVPVINLTKRFAGGSGQSQKEKRPWPEVSGGVESSQ